MEMIIPVQIESASNSGLAGQQSAAQAGPEAEGSSFLNALSAVLANGDKPTEETSGPEQLSGKQESPGTDNSASHDLFAVLLVQTNAVPQEITGSVNSGECKDNGSCVSDPRRLLSAHNCTEEVSEGSNDNKESISVLDPRSLIIALNGTETVSQPEGRANHGDKEGGTKTSDAGFSSETLSSVLKDIFPEVKNGNEDDGGNSQIKLIKPSVNISGEDKNIPGENENSAGNNIQAVTGNAGKQDAQVKTGNAEKQHSRPIENNEVRHYFKDTESKGFKLPETVSVNDDLSPGSEIIKADVSGIADAGQEPSGNEQRSYLFEQKDPEVMTSLKYSEGDSKQMSSSFNPENRSNSSHSSEQVVPRPASTEHQEKFTMTMKNNSSIEVTLEPEGMGKLDLEVVLDKGIVNTQINASESIGKELIEKNLHNIVSALSRDGFNVGGFSVTLRDRRGGSTDIDGDNTGEESISDDKVQLAADHHSDRIINIYI